MYSHGFLIPLISLYLVWAKRNLLALIPYRPSRWISSAVLVLGVGMLLAGYATGIPTIQELSLLFTVTGIVVLLFGLSSLKILWLPIVYLLFMIPVWEEAVTGHFHLPFQNISARNGIVLLNLLGIPAHREGLFIELPGTVLEVARACSGVNHLIAVIAIGIPLAYLFLSGWTRRILLILIAMVIAISANGLRVALIGILSYFNIGSPLHGPFHILQGLFVSAVGYVALFFCTWALSGRSPSARNPVNKKKPDDSGPIGWGPKNKRPYALFSAVIFFAAAGSYMNFHSFSPVQLKKKLDQFPQEIGNWVGGPGNSSFSGLFKEARVDQELVRTYREKGRKAVELYIGYFEYQDSTKKVINYRTEDIHRNLSLINVNGGPGEALEINKGFQRGKAKDSLVFFWYDINGRIVTSRLTGKLYTAWSGLVRGRSNGAIVILSCDVAPNEDLNGAEEGLKDFIRTAYPLFREFLPGHKAEPN
jgi:EpsI family protein